VKSFDHESKAQVRERHLFAIAFSTEGEAPAPTPIGGSTNTRLTLNRCSSNGSRESFFLAFATRIQKISGSATLDTAVAVNLLAFAAHQGAYPIGFTADRIKGVKAGELDVKMCVSNPVK
jgi:hypothetical protein